MSSSGTSSDEVATQEMCVYCYDVIINDILGGDVNPGFEERSSALLGNILDTTICPLFVTWDKHIAPNKDNSDCSEDSFRLRGCIGTLAPRKLQSALEEYAIISAFRDHRFDPIDIEEIPQLRVAVSLLVNYEDCNNCFDWEVGRHGIIIKFHAHSKYFNATYLPEVASEQGWSQQKTIETLVRKAGYRGTISHDLLSKIQCTRYQSSKIRLTYANYVSLIGHDPVMRTLNSKLDNKSKKESWKSWLRR